MPELTKPGGVSYEFVLEEARTQRSEHPHLKCPATPTPSAQDIERKLKSAEERRRSRGASALQRFAEKEKRAEEVRAKKASLPATSHEGEEEN